MGVIGEASPDPSEKIGDRAEPVEYLKGGKLDSPISPE